VIQVVVEDLAFVEADAVVRPATARLGSTSPSLRRLEQVGGPAFWQALKIHDPLDVGAAVVTPGGDLAAELVIHAVVWSDTEPVMPAGVRRALTSVLQRAADWQLARIAMPPIGTGPGNLSIEDAARIMADVLTRDLPHATYPKEVCIVVESEEDREIFEGLLRGMVQ
jgi:O-acetyl-ADP-ribose deacetylase (regulator of RNase III)